MSKDIKKALEHCIEWNCADCPNREELGSGETVCRGRLLPYVLEYVSDLEAKLAESNESHHKNIVELTKMATEKDRKIEELKQQLGIKEQEHELLINHFEEATEELRKQIKQESDARKRFVEAVKKLKQQLAEKEKELHYKTAECEKWKADYENCSKLEKMMAKEHQYCLDNWRASEQDKIDFTIENLKQVKEKIANLDMPNNPKLYNDDMFQSGYDVHYVKVRKVIDNQIKQLKEMK